MFLKISFDRDKDFYHDEPVSVTEKKRHFIATSTRFFKPRLFERSLTLLEVKGI